MVEKKSNTKKIVLINLAAMLVAVVLLPFIVLAWLDSYTLHGEAITVPNVCGMQLEEAAETMRANKLDFEVVDYKYVKGAKEDEVLEQRPEANEKVKEGRKIALTMSSKHEPMQIVPNIIDNCSLREAQARLRAAGFKLAPNVEIAGEKDWVYMLLVGKDTIHNGMKIPVGSTVTLVIGSGKDKVHSEPIVDNSWFE